MPSRSRWWQSASGMCMAVIVVAGCASGAKSTSSTIVEQTTSTTGATTTVAGIVVHTNEQATPFDRRLLGTNLPAWIGPQRLKDPKFIAAAKASGTTMVRMPGGSWADGYHWLACENGDSGCSANWAAKPSDFLEFMRTTGIAGMWTVSFNTTAQEAAAVVAFFNGHVGDARVIGVDRNGKDWGTVGQWATLRASHGSPDPVPITYWEVGNEVYGAKQSAGSECASWGWEDVWTCDGTDYVNGDKDHDGYLQFRAAMVAVDPSILVGAVGVAKQSDWSGWGNKVISAAGSALDFYSVHQYAFGSRPAIGDVLPAPSATWKGLMTNVQAALSKADPHRAVPVAVTEYNLVSFQDADQDRLMTKSVNALFLADTIGQMAQQGVTIANQYDLINGKASNGTDYGMVDADSMARNPQYYALALWSMFGDAMSPVSTTFKATQLSVYGGTDAAHRMFLLAINKTDKPISTSVGFDGATGPYGATANVMSASALDGTDVAFNGSDNTSDGLAAHTALDLGSHSGPLTHEFPPYSITLLRLAPATG